MKSFNEFSDSKTVKYWDCVIEFKYSDSNFIRKMNRSDVNEPHFLVNTSEKKYNTLEDAERFLYSEMNNLLKN